MSTLKVNNITDLGNDSVVTNGVLDTLAVPAGGILQVVSTSKTDTFSTTSTSFTGVTGLSATITPRATSSKILAFFSVQGSGAGLGFYRLARNGTGIGVANADGLRTQASAQGFESDVNSVYTTSNSFLDSPSTVSTLTYQVQLLAESGTLHYVNMDRNNQNLAARARVVSSITLIEVAG
jgi:hypothetical protein